MKRQKKKLKKKRVIQPIIECPNCHERIEQGHFVPASFGDEGFFICEPQTKTEQRRRNENE